MIASSDAEDITGGEWRKEKGGGGVIHRFAPIETGTNSGPRHRPPRVQRYMRFGSQVASSGQIRIEITAATISRT